MTYQDEELFSIGSNEEGDLLGDEGGKEDESQPDERETEDPDAEDEEIE